MTNMTSAFLSCMTSNLGHNASETSANIKKKDGEADSQVIEQYKDVFRNSIMEMRALKMKK